MTGVILVAKVGSYFQRVDAEKKKSSEKNPRKGF
jgi:hypothetical protein